MTSSKTANCPDPPGLLPGETVIDRLRFGTMTGPGNLILTDQRIVVHGSTNSLGAEYTLVRGSMILAAPLTAFESMIVGSGKRPWVLLFSLALAVAAAVMFYLPPARHAGLMVAAMSLTAFLVWAVWGRTFLTIAAGRLKVTGKVARTEAMVFMERLQLAVLAAKANYRALGPRFGKQSSQWAKAIEALPDDQILSLRREGVTTLTVDGRSEILGHEEIQVREQGIAPFAVTSEGGLTVALDTTLDDALRAEGLVREIISKVQNLRKKSGLEVSDRIRLGVEGPAPVLAAVQAHADRICQETLAESLAADGELPHRDVFRIDDSEITITLARI